MTNCFSRIKTRAVERTALAGRRIADFMNRPISRAVADHIGSATTKYGCCTLNMAITSPVKKAAKGQIEETKAIEYYNKKLKGLDGTELKMIVQDLKSADVEFLSRLEHRITITALREANDINDNGMSYGGYALEDLVVLLHRIGSKNAAKTICEVIDILGPEKAMGEIISPLREIGDLTSVPALVKMLQAHYYPRGRAIAALEGILSRCDTIDEIYAFKLSMEKTIGNMDERQRRKIIGSQIRIEGMISARAKQVHQPSPYGQRGYSIALANQPALGI